LPLPRFATTAATGAALEEIENAAGDEAAAHRQNLAIGMPMLMAAGEAQWLCQMEIMLGARLAPDCAAERIRGHFFLLPVGSRRGGANDGLSNCQSVART
jgi:hypothetical protein